jgi:hypothetical protein
VIFRRLLNAPCSLPNHLGDRVENAGLSPADPTDFVIASSVMRQLAGQAFGISTEARNVL